MILKEDSDRAHTVGLVAADRVTPAQFYTVRRGGRRLSRHAMPAPYALNQIHLYFGQPWATWRVQRTGFFASTSEHVSGLPL